MNCFKQDPRQKITIEQMAWVFEQLDEDVPLKVLAIDLNIDVSTLSRRIKLAEKYGFETFKHPSKRRYEIQTSTKRTISNRTPSSALQSP